MEILGRSPIPLFILIVGKLAMGACWLFPLVRLYAPETMLVRSTPLDLIALVLGVAGLLLAGSAIARLGRTITVGLPTAETKLKTHGPYSFSRNPIYLGAFLMCLGSVLFAPHVINILLLLLTVGIHHWIIVNEEKFLANRFGEEWVHYKQLVHRYL